MKNSIALVLVGFVFLLTSLLVLFSLKPIKREPNSASEAVSDHQSNVIFKTDSGGQIHSITEVGLVEKSEKTQAPTEFNMDDVALADDGGLVDHSIAATTNVATTNAEITEQECQYYCAEREQLSKTFTAQEIAQFYESGEYFLWDPPFIKKPSIRFLKSIKDELTLSEIHRHVYEGDKIEPRSAYVYLMRRAISKHKRSNPESKLPAEILEYFEKVCIDGVKKGNYGYAIDLAFYYLYSLEDPVQSFSWLIVARYLGSYSFPSNFSKLPLEDPEFVAEANELAQTFIKFYLAGFKPDTGRPYEDFTVIGKTW